MLFYVPILNSIKYSIFNVLVAKKREAKLKEFTKTRLIAHLDRNSVLFNFISINLNVLLKVSNICLK